jgi:hypothetical protein
MASVTNLAVWIWWKSIRSLRVIGSVWELRADRLFKAWRSSSGSARKDAQDLVDFDRSHGSHRGKQALSSILGLWAYRLSEYARSQSRQCQGTELVPTCDILFRGKSLGSFSTSGVRVWLARAAFAEAVQRRPGKVIILRQRSRVLADSRT